MGINNGQAKWERKTSNAGGKWLRNLSTSNYVEGVVEGSDGALSASQVSGSQPAAAYQDFVASATAEQYQSQVSGKGQKWKNNWLDAFRVSS